MAGASSSRISRMIVALREPDLEIQKSIIEDEVFHMILGYWEELQELKLLYDSGEATTPSLVERLKQLRKHLHITGLVDAFTDGHVYQLMLRKELKLLKRFAHSDSFLQGSTAPLSAWLKIRIIAIEEKYDDVVCANVYGYMKNLY